MRAKMRHISYLVKGSGAEKWRIGGMGDEEGSSAHSIGMGERGRSDQILSLVRRYRYDTGAWWREEGERKNECLRVSLTRKPATSRTFVGNRVA